MKYLTYEIYAVDPEDETKTALIGTCFNKGLAKTWIESCITRDNFLLKNKDTLQIWKYDSKKKEWK